MSGRALRMASTIRSFRCGPMTRGQSSKSKHSMLAPRIRAAASISRWRALLISSIELPGLAAHSAAAFTKGHVADVNGAARIDVSGGGAARSGTEIRSVGAEHENSLLPVNNHDTLQLVSENRVGPGLALVVEKTAAQDFSLRRAERFVRTPPRAEVSGSGLEFARVAAL